MAEDANKTQGHANGKTHERIDRAAERVKQEAGEAARAAKSKTERAEVRVDQAADAGAQAAHRAADKAADWRERGTAAAYTMRDRADNLMEDARECVREKPVQSVAIALAAGWLVGRLLGSRR
jgi:ElaB/YqjD/DUF883 family membrane-anchored ribosome-binding protein